MKNITVEAESVHGRSFSIDQNCHLLIITRRNGMQVCLTDCSAVAHPTIHSYKDCSRPEKTKMATLMTMFLPNRGHGDERAYEDG